MNLLPCTIDDGIPYFGGLPIPLGSRRDPPPSAKKLELGVRPEFVDLGADGVPVEIVKVSDAGRYRIVETKHGDNTIKLLADADAELPADSVHVRFDPSHTQVYADGWMVEAAS